MFKTSCPRCKTEQSHPSEQEGKSIQCSVCQYTFNALRQTSHKKGEDQYLLIDDTGAERGLTPSSEILRMCKERLIANKAQLSKKGILSPYRSILDYPQFAAFVGDKTVESDRQQEAKRLQEEAQRLHEAEHNPPHDAEMFLRVNEEDRGPYTTQQIRAMWASGGLPSNTLFYYDAIGDWKSAKSFCQTSASTRWEYHREVIDLSYWSTSADVKSSEAEKILHARGHSGWELVSVCPITDTKFASSTATSQLVFFFKRQAR